MDIKELIHELHAIIDREELDRAKDLIGYLQEILGSQNPELVYANQLIHFLEV